MDMPGMNGGCAIWLRPDEYRNARAKKNAPAKRGGVNQWCTGEDSERRIAMAVVYRHPPLKTSAADQRAGAGSAVAWTRRSGLA